jgi:hypothetical protein
VLRRLVDNLKGKVQKNDLKEIYENFEILIDYQKVFLTEERKSI